MDKDVTILCGDAKEQLQLLPAGSVHCCVTSPPYWQLRDYGVEGQIGLEESLELYMDRIREVFREVFRVLRTDGTLWLNLGDSYFGSGKGYNKSPCKQDTNRGSRRGTIGSTKGFGKGKELAGIPWRIALMLQSDGWYLRRDIIWHKTNPMPESAKDRPTTAHEYLFLFSKSKRYFYDAHAIKEPASAKSHSRGNGLNPKAGKVPSGWDTSRGKGGHGNFLKSRQNPSFSTAVKQIVAERNKRSVWTIPSAPFRGAHFATFPPALVKPCILAGTSENGCCSVCGTPWERRIEKGEANREWQMASGSNSSGEYHGRNTKDYQAHKAQPASTVKARILAGMRVERTVGWDPGCDCGAMFASPTPCIVMDPFAGSGTVGAVARDLGRRSVLIELNPEYIPLIQARCRIPATPLQATL
jgi:DNA modification methylase